MPAINTDRFSADLRRRSVDKADERVLVTNFVGSQQEKDLSEPVNCAGFGRVRHFRYSESSQWPGDPLPLVPAFKALQQPPQRSLRSQVFQNAACNWRCWYCFVDFELLSADPKRSKLLSCSELLGLYLKEENRPKVIDLSGGQPDLVPEWVPWMMKALTKFELDHEVYLWSDDNLSNDYLWQFLTSDQIALMREYPKYGRVGCFKGFDNESFAFNTNASPRDFDRQFEIAERLLGLRIDQYFYTNFTCENLDSIEKRMSCFVDRLQRLNEDVPLRTIPLEIRTFTPVQRRLTDRRERSLHNQYVAVDHWRNELARRFTSAELTRLAATLEQCGKKS
jgi:uncharacterized Fe-S cluster-containing radical SAM superfamily protein